MYKILKQMNKHLKFSGCLFFAGVVSTGMYSCKNQTPKKQTNDVQEVETSGQQKNILLLISDDHGIDQLGCYGNNVIKTPHLDSLASNGVRMTNAYAVAASCSASRGAILSGLYPHQSGQYGHNHNWHHFSYFDTIQSIPAILKQNGYQTGCVGKLHVGPQELLPFDYRIPASEIMNNRDVKKMALKAGEFFNKDKDKPFFLLVGYSDPHRMPHGWSDMPGIENWDGFGNHLDYQGVKPEKYNPDNMPVPDFLPDTRAVREELAQMYESISRMDQGIGMVLEELRKSGRFDNTLIVYISDNGIPFPGAKTTIYDSGVRMPMIVSHSALKNKGGKTDAMISFTDILPTFIDWAEVELPEYQLPGKSFLTAMGEKNPEGWDKVMMSHTFHEITMYYPMRAIRNHKYKYINNLYPELEFPFATDLFICKTWQDILKNQRTTMGKRSVEAYLRRPTEELYNITDDAAEAVNLAQDSSYSVVLQEMREQLHALRSETKDPWLIKENYTQNTAYLKYLQKE